MRKILIGLFFVLFSFTFALDSIVIELIPSFIGYILFTNGLAEVQSFSGRFQKARSWAIVLSVYTAILFLLDLTGYARDLNETPIISILLGLIASLIQVYVLYCIALGVADAEVVLQRHLNSSKLKTVWSFWCLATVTTYLLTFLSPEHAGGYLWIIVSWIVAIAYMITFNQTKKLFYAHEPPPFHGENRESSPPSDGF